VRLKAEQVPSHLSRGPLLPVYFVSGDEPLQMMEVTDAIRARALAEGCERTVLEVARGFDWGELARAGAEMSLFSSRRLIELRLGDQSPGREGADALVAWAGSPPQDNVLLATSGKLDGRTRQGRWYKALEGAGAVIELWPVEPARLPAWIAQRVERAGRRIERDAAEIIAQRVEGNLLAAAQEIDKLLLLVSGKSISAEDVQRAVADSARFDAFALVDAGLLGDAPRGVRTLRGLRQEGHELPAVLGAVMWELRNVCSMVFEMAAGSSRDEVMSQHGVWQQRRARVTAALRRLDRNAAGRLLVEAARVDRAIKGMDQADPWRLLEEFLLHAGGTPLLR
jgi:DNA polymerase-3 subunit delta